MAGSRVELVVITMSRRPLGHKRRLTLIDLKDMRLVRILAIAKFVS
jgi:hypothetical protein